MEGILPRACSCLLSSASTNVLRVVGGPSAFTIVDDFRGLRKILEPSQLSSRAFTQPAKRNDVAVTSELESHFANQTIVHGHGIASLVS